METWVCRQFETSVFTHAAPTTQAGKEFWSYYIFFGIYIIALVLDLIRGITDHFAALARKIDSAARKEKRTAQRETRRQIRASRKLAQKETT